MFHRAYSSTDPARRRFLAAAARMAATLLAARAAGAAGAASAADTSIAGAERKRAAELADICSASNATGTGLRGEYFSRDPTRAAPLLVRVDATVDFDAALEWPAELAAQRPAWARWTGWVKPPISGRYRFHASQPDVRVVVARQAMVGEGAEAGASIDLVAGRFYPITLEARRLDAMTGRLSLEWTAPFGARYVVPRALLFVPSEDAVANRS